MIVTLIRFALISTNGIINNEPTPPIGLAYIASSCKKNPGLTVKGIDATGRNLNKIFKISKGNLQGNGIEIDEIIKLIDPKTKIFGISVMFSHEWTYIKDCLKILKKKFPKSIFINHELTDAFLNPQSNLDVDELTEVLDEPDEPAPIEHEGIVEPETLES